MFDDDGYRTLAEAVIDLAVQDARFVSTCRPVVLPEALGEREYQKVERARNWLTRGVRTEGLELWCGWLGIPHEAVVQRSTCSLRMTCEAEERLRWRTT